VASVWHTTLPGDGLVPASPPAYSYSSFVIRHYAECAIDLQGQIGAIAIGGIIAALAATLGGISGFGASLVSTPLLLLLGFPLPLVVPVNLTLVVLTRISVAYRFRTHLIFQRVGQLVIGSLPGVVLGSWVVANVSPAIIKRGIGFFVMGAVLILIGMARRPAPKPLPGAPLVAGLLGGFCGATSSLNGVPPAVLLARDRVAPRTFQADLALYFVLSNLLTLALLGWHGAIDRGRIAPIAALWLPGALAGNLIGAQLSTRLPDQSFRRLTLLVAFLAGAITALTA
jgi:uncharacterized membrane protein YfcA